MQTVNRLFSQTFSSTARANSPGWLATELLVRAGTFSGLYFKFLTHSSRYDLFIVFVSQFI